MNNNLVTVVVPVYNVEKYIEKCLNSIIEQTYRDIEIIIVNDGSKDKSIDICEKIQSKDSRIKIINQKNAGLSAARNTGIQNASGKYICFVDSDDFLDKNYVRLLLENLIKNGADISVCDYIYIDEKGKTWTRKIKHNKVYSNIEAIKDLLVGTQNTEVMTWNKLYKLSLFKEHNIYFPERKLHEDNFTTYKLYYYSQSISLINDRLYFYLQRTNSIMGKKFNIKRLDVLQAVQETKEFLINKHIDLKAELECYQALIQIQIFNNMIRDNFYGRERKELIRNIKKNRKVYLHNEYITLPLKFFICILIGKGKLYAILLLFLDKIRKRRHQ